MRDAANAPTEVTLRILRPFRRPGVRVPLLPESAQVFEVMRRHYDHTALSGWGFTAPLWDRAKEWCARGRERLALRKMEPLSFDD